MLNLLKISIFKCCACFTNQCVNPAFRLFSIYLCLAPDDYKYSTIGYSNWNTNFDSLRRENLADFEPTERASKMLLSQTPTRDWQLDTTNWNTLLKAYLTWFIHHVLTSFSTIRPLKLPNDRRLGNYFRLYTLFMSFFDANNTHCLLYDQTIGFSLSLQSPTVNWSLDVCKILPKRGSFSTTKQPWKGHCPTCDLISISHDTDAKNWPFHPSISDVYSGDFPR